MYKSTLNSLGDLTHIELSVVIPVFNQALTIEKTLRAWIQFLEEEVKYYEIIVVNDGSTDGSARIIDKLRKDHSSIRAIHQLRTGTGTAIKRGYDASRGRYVLHLEPSGQFEPSDLMALFNVRTGKDLVLIRRTHRFDSIFSRFSTKLFSYFLKILFKFDFSEPNISFRLYEQAALRSAMMQLPKHSYHTDLLLGIIIHNFAGKVVETTIPFRFAKSKVQYLKGKINAFIIGFYEVIKLKLECLLNNIGISLQKREQIY